MRRLSLARKKIQQRRPIATLAQKFNRLLQFAV